MEKIKELPKILYVAEIHTADIQDDVWNLDSMDKYEELLTLKEALQKSKESNVDYIKINLNECHRIYCDCGKLFLYSDITEKEYYK